MQKPFFKLNFLILIALNCFVFLPGIGNAENRVVNLTIAYKWVNFTGKWVRGTAINNTIPGPTLHFKEGDHVTINVYNHTDSGATIHWHGLIVPWRMDGVADVSQKPIPPGGVFHYKFTLKQAGTYWYHSHYLLQEQDGVYGAFIVAPPHQRLKYNKAFVVLLSDWSNVPGSQVFDNLKKDGDYYSPKFPLQPSLMHFLKTYKNASASQRKRLLKVYWSMQQTRMGTYDISDIAYDTFLMNGHPPTRPWFGHVKTGETIRLRFIGAGASTIFHVKIPGVKMKMVQVDGNDIKPYYVKSFFIAPGETYDVLVKITKKTPYIIYAESSGQVGAALGALINKKHQKVDFKNVKPFPEPAPKMMKMAYGSKPGVNPSRSTPTQYDPMESIIKTNNPNVPVHIIKMNLTGYMGRYIWFINGKPEYKAKPIMIQHGQRYRIIFLNNTVMSHPMHIHGHWFILRNGHGAYDPLLHTINVPAGSTVVADFDANEKGQWYFHCHNLYHMKAGMATILRYKTPKGKKTPDFLPGDNKPGWFYSTRADFNGDFANHVYQLTINSLMGTDFNKFQIFMNQMEINDGTIDSADVDFFYYRPISQFWALKGGLNYTYRPAETPYVQPGIGIEGLAPFFIDTNVRAYYHDDSAKLDIELNRATQITNNFFVSLGIRGIFATKTVRQDEIGNGLNSTEFTVRPYYRIDPQVALYFQYQNTHYYSSLKRILESDNLATDTNLYSVGVSFLF